MIKFSLILFVFAIAITLNGQTGPGGIGSSTNNLFWLDANTLGLANGAQVANWIDNSGNTVTASQTTPSQRPIFRTNQSNGFPAVDFDGVNDYLRTGAMAGFNADQTVTYIYVIRPDNLAQSSNPYTNSFGTSGSNLQSRLHGGICTTSGGLFSFARTASALIKGDHSNSISYKVQSAVLTSSDISGFSNGSATGFQAGATSVPVNHNFFILGLRPYLNDLPFDGKIAEFIGFDDALTLPQRIIVENYLASKYGIAMTANDHFAMEGSGHYFNVAGIGMEGGNSVTDAEGRSLVRINSASSLANGDYLLWGHNNASLTVNAVNVPSEFAAFSGTRLNRTWRIDETGDVGTYTVAINMATMPALGASTADYVLMIDDDGDFSNGGTTYHSSGYSFASNTATWTGVDIPDGSYFTVAYVPAIFSIITGNWSSSSTWNCACVPTSADRPVFISAGDQVTVDASSSVSDLTILATGSLIFTGLNELVVTGDLDNQGTLDGNDGRLTMGGSSAQIINSSSAIPLEEFEIDNSSGVTIASGSYTVISTGTVFPTNGDLDVSGVSFLFDSDASGTARIDQMAATASITGNVTYRRFIAAGTGGYRDIATPMLNGNAVTDWDDDMFISGETSDGFADGCAYSNNQCFYSFKLMEANAYTDITLASDIIPNAFYGIHAWMADGYPAALGSPITIDLTGEVTPFGSIDVDLFGNGMFTLVGNPYISQIDFDLLGRASINNYYYIWDVNINNYNWYQIGNGASPLADEIASGQGFLVAPSALSGTLTFNENDKTSAAATFIRSSESNEFFRLALNRTDMKYACDVTFNFTPEAKNEFDEFDILTPYGLDSDAVYISAKVEDKIVRCFGMNNREVSVSVPISIKIPDQGFYTLNTSNMDLFDQYTCVVLEDLETGSRYNLRNMDAVRFFVEKTGNEETRFMVHFSNDACEQSVAGIDINDNQSTVEMTNFNEYVKVDMNFSTEENVTISFYNMLGQPVLGEQFKGVTSKSVNIQVPDNIANGVYLVVVETAKKRYTRKYSF